MILDSLIPGVRPRWFVDDHETGTYRIYVQTRWGVAQLSGPTFPTHTDALTYLDAEIIGLGRLEEGH